MLDQTGVVILLIHSRYSTQLQHLKDVQIKLKLGFSYRFLFKYCWPRKKILNLFFRLKEIPDSAHKKKKIKSKNPKKSDFTSDKSSFIIAGMWNVMPLMDRIIVICVTVISVNNSSCILRSIALILTDEEERALD